jgi:hypothetical protein
MRTFLSLIVVLQFASSPLYSGDFDPNGTVQPSLEARVRDSAFIVLTSVEVRHGFIAYKVLESWKGTYDSKNFPDQYKGFFTDYTRPRDYYQCNPKHSLEIRFSGKGSNIISPSQSQPDSGAIYFTPSTMYPNMYQLPVINDVVIYPLRVRGGDEKILDEQKYSFGEIKALIQEMVKKGAS